MKDILRDIKKELGENPSRDDLGNHFAQRICGLERGRRAVRLEGDATAVAQTTNELSRLKKAAREVGLNSDTHPGLFRP